MSFTIRLVPCLAEALAGSSTWSVIAQPSVAFAQARLDVSTRSGRIAAQRPPASSRFRAARKWRSAASGSACRPMMREKGGVMSTTVGRYDSDSRSDRKSVVEEKNVLERVDLGGRRII